MGLNKSEEDDLIHLWNFSTLYFMFFSPENNDFDEYADFSKMKDKKKKRILKYYYRCVQRHEFVFNRKQNARFLSKNPLMIPKIKELHNIFPDMKLITIYRIPEKAIASTLSMNEIIYNSFSKGPSSKEWIDKIILVLIEWQKTLDNLNVNHKLNLNFEQIIDKDKIIDTDRLIAEYLNIPDFNWIQKESNLNEKETHHKSKHTHFHLTPDQKEIIMNSFKLKS